ncbi:MAG: hypothetical protein HY319_11850 [Armatimonadetes bacterium]|nr:hypothetical protein [Armatimonadota bacterium]
MSSNLTCAQTLQAETLEHELLHLGHPSAADVGLGKGGSDRECVDCHFCFSFAGFDCL